MEVVQIPLLNSDRVALIDAADLPLVEGHPWRIYRSGSYKGRSLVYAGYQKKIDGKVKNILMHRLILPGSPEVDHANGDGLDNRRCNIRSVTHAQNMMNKRMHRNNKCGFKGVYWSNRDRWRVQIQVDGRKIERSGFNDPEDAARAYDELALEHHGEFARLNFPNEVAG